jgi:hypothetical protein
MLTARFSLTKSESRYDDSMSRAVGHPSNWRHWLPRFTLRQLLLATALVAVGCYALRWASPWWSILLFYIGLALVVVGLLIAINRPGAPRSFWLAFAVLALMHWMLVFKPGLENGIPAHFPGVFVTHWLSAYSYKQLKPHLTVEPIRVDPWSLGSIRGRWGGEYLHVPSGASGASASVPSFHAGEDGYFRGFGPGPFYIFEADFVNVALGLWTLLLAYLGGHISLALYRRSAHQGEA